jgi:hypothetical protein
VSYTRNLSRENSTGFSLGREARPAGKCAATHICDILRLPCHKCESIHTCDVSGLHGHKVESTQLFLIALLWLLSLLSAHATYRADFFDKSKPPTIAFNKKAMTWTLRNQAVERVIKFDEKTGSLETLALRNLRSKREIVPEPGAEGILSFQPALMEPPVPLTDWKVTDKPPSANWTKPDFDAKDWKPAKLPLTTRAEDTTFWLRAEIPADRMLAGRAYGVLIERNPNVGVEVFVDGERTLQIQPFEKFDVCLLQGDLVPKNRYIALKVTTRSNGEDGVRSTHESELVHTIGIAEVGSSPQTIDLKSDWKYMTHAFNAGEDGSKTLSITLAGKGRHEGFELHVNYQIYPGEEPTLAKWFLFVSHRPTRFLLESVTYDGWQLPASSSKAPSEKSRPRLMTVVLSPLGAVEGEAGDKTIRSVLRPYLRVKPETALLLPKSVVSVYDGPKEIGDFLLQLYTGQYVAHGTPTAMLPAYNTRYSYGLNVSAAACLRNIPLASQLGLKLFILGDGWQTNAAPDSGRIGDWVVDRSKDKFPQGLMPISLLVRQYNMRFGLWSAPTLVSEKSQAAQTLSDYLLRPLDGTRTLQMCFTTGWEENYSQSMLLLCRELTVSYLHLNKPVFEDICTNPTHDHPVAHAQSEQAEHWRLFGEKMRKLDPNFLLAYEETYGDAETAVQDTCTFDSWMLVKDSGQTMELDATYWRLNTAIARIRLQEAAKTRPSFALTAIAPARLPGAEKDLNALEYCLTSAAAMVCNLEIHGELDKMTFEERGLVQKWVKWNEENRPWLAFTQPLEFQDKSVDGILHLRNALDGRYGYICLWNPGDKAAKVPASFRPADYFVRMNLSKVELIRVRDGKPVAFRADGDTLRLDAELAPNSWEIYEIRTK